MPVSDENAISICIEGIKENVQHPSTVDPHILTGTSIRRGVNGNTSVRMKFDAKNPFGLKLTFEANCLVLPKGELEINIKEK